MPRIFWFGLGVLARAVSIVAGLYSDWIWNKLVEGAEFAVDFAQDFWEFACWAVDELAGYLSGRRRYELNY